MPKKEREISIIECPVLFTEPMGQKFEKEILYEGEFVHPQHPNKRMIFDLKRLQGIIDNFNKKLIDIVYVPLNHSARPEDNTGFVEGLVIKNSIAKPGKKGLFAKINIALADIAEKIGKTIKGCSVGLEQYMNPETGKLEGECLGHLALTNEPYIPNLGEYEALAFSKEDLVKVYFYRQAEEEEKNINGEDIQMEKELADLKAKNLELEKQNHEKDEKLEAEKKKVDSINAEKAKMEQEKFELEVSTKVDNLVMSKKVLTADKEKETKFAISLGRTKGMEYLDENVAKRQDVIDLSVKSKNGSETHKDKDATTLKASRINSIFVDFMMGKGGNKLTDTHGNETICYERAVNAWNGIVTELKDVKEIKLEMDVDETIEFSSNPYKNKITL